MSIKIKRIKNTDDLAQALVLLHRYFQPYELVASNEFVYYAENYRRLYPDEDYMVFKITCDNEYIGMMSGVKLKGFVAIDYLIIDSGFRKYTKDVINEISRVLMKFRRPVIVEAETDVLVRFYKMLGFKCFAEEYQYHILHVEIGGNGGWTSSIMSHDSHLMYYSDEPLDFVETRNTLYRKHYLRWNSVYPDDLTAEYKKLIEGIIKTDEI